MVYFLLLASLIFLGIGGVYLVEEVTSEMALTIAVVFVLQAIAVAIHEHD